MGMAGVIEAGTSLPTTTIGTIRPTRPRWPLARVPGPEERHLTGSRRPGRYQHGSTPETRRG